MRCLCCNLNTLQQPRCWPNGLAEHYRGSVARSPILQADRPQFIASVAVQSPGNHPLRCGSDPERATFMRQATGRLLAGNRGREEDRRLQKIKREVTYAKSSSD
jgi:hypothetical protein